jgi:hypothetical protein
MGNFFLCMLTAARTTPLLVLMGAKAEGVIWFHKLTSRAAIFWLAVHGALCGRAAWGRARRRAGRAAYAALGPPQTVVRRRCAGAALLPAAR